MVHSAKAWLLQPLCLRRGVLPGLSQGGPHSTRLPEPLTPGRCCGPFAQTGGWCLPSFIYSFKFDHPVHGLQDLSPPTRD